MTARHLTWHVPPDDLVAYLDDTISVARASSVESHLLACDACRANLARSSAPVTTWAALERRIDDEPVRVSERIARWVGVDDPTVRLLAPTPGLRWSWLVATALALMCAALATRLPWGGGDGLARVVFLTIAPLAPLAAVVTALGAAGEPAPEIAAATPAPRLCIGAIRAALVLAAAIVIGALASLLLPAGAGSAAAWLGPAFALSAVGALLAPRFPATTVVSGLAVAWVSIVAVAARASGDVLAAFRAGPQVAAFAIAAAGAVLLMARPGLAELRRSS